MTSTKNILENLHEIATWVSTLPEIRVAEDRVCFTHVSLYQVRLGLRTYDRLLFNHETSSALCISAARMATPTPQLKVSIFR